MTIGEVLDAQMAPVCIERCGRSRAFHHRMTYWAGAVHVSMDRFRSKATTKSLYRVLLCIAQYVYRGYRGANVDEWQRLYFESRWVEHEWTHTYHHKARFGVSRRERRAVLLAAERAGISLRTANRRAYQWATLELRRENPSYGRRYP